MVSTATAAIIGASATMLAAIGGFIAAMRRSGAEGDDHWQDLVRGQLEAQITRNNELDKKVSDLWEALDREKAERRRIEGKMADRIALLESILRLNGITIPS